MLFSTLSLVSLRNLAGQNIRPFETGIQKLGGKDWFIGGLRRLKTWIQVEWRFQIEIQGGEMIFGVHRYDCVVESRLLAKKRDLARGSE
jgi:hypothetical protein